MRGVLVAVVQVALIGAVGGKLLYDRASLPRAWVETAGVDPELPIRGRYVTLYVVLPVSPESVATEREAACGRIELRGAQPVAVLEGDAGGVANDVMPGRSTCFRRTGDGNDRWMLVEPVAFFLSEHAKDPTLRAQPHELWVEVTLPRRGAPRPIRLGLKRDAGIEPLG
jgi:hypothetical protein